MKKSILIPLFLVAFIVMPAIHTQCQSLKEIQSKIEKLNAEMTSAMVNGDYEKSLSFYADDAISLPNYQPMMVGMEAISMSNEGMANSGVKINSFNVSIKKIIMDGDLIVEIGTYNMSMEIPSMEGPINDIGKYMTVWEKQKDGSLKVKAETWNTDSNPWMQGGGM